MKRRDTRYMSIEIVRQPTRSLGKLIGEDIGPHTGSKVKPTFYLSVFRRPSPMYRLIDLTGALHA